MKFNFYRLSFVFLLFLSLLLSNNIQSQDLLASRRTSYNSFVYKITEKEAGVIQKKGSYKIDSTFFHTLVDIYPTDSIYKGKLAPGHYLKTFANGSKQDIFYVFVPDFDVKIFNNTSDLCIQVVDLKGNIIDNALVKIGNSRIYYDKKTGLYIDKKSNKSGLLTVKAINNEAYYHISKKRNNPAIQRAYRGVLRFKPIRYVVQPISYVISLPFDAVTSLIKQRPYGAINTTKWMIRRWGTKIENWIYRDDLANLKYKGYLVFNKPKFLPGDTVKFKSYLVNEHGKPLNKDVYVCIFNGTKTIKIKKLSPYYPGAFTGSFFLHDSLGLKLDKDYTVSIEQADGDEYIKSWIKYEAYELNNISLEFRTSSENHYAEKPFYVFAKGVDENKLNIADARLELLLLTENVDKVFDAYTYIPDTLWRYKINLKASGETKIEIPDSLFGLYNIRYNLQARMLNSENKAVSKNSKINYYYKHTYFDYKLIKDSVQIKFIENGNEKITTAKLFANDNFGNSTFIDSIKTPYTFKLNPYYDNYSVLHNRTYDLFSIKSASSGLQCSCYRFSDSVYIEVNNPRKLKFVYNIYRHNTDVKRGSGTSLDYKFATKAKENYYISIRYLWGGRVKEEMYNIPYIEKELQISVEQPKLIYPGQKVPFEITVKNQSGKAVEGVDLTAFALTEKFKYKAPNLPSFDINKPVKEDINSFTVNEKRIDKQSNILNYEAWKALAEIDSLAYYKFLYPGKGIYTFNYKTTDNITQFAPFVVSKYGCVLPVHIVYVDYKPVYFRWSTNNPPYSFAVSEGKHFIELRLQDRSIFIRNMEFKPGYKTIFSFSEDLVNKNIYFEKKPSTLQITEQANLNKYVFPFRNIQNNAYAYVKDDKSIQLLKGNLFNNMAGPFIGQIHAGIIDGFNVTLQHEPFFEYDIAPSLVKMREVSEKKMPTTRFLYSGDKLMNFKDSVLTQSALINLKKLEDQQLYNFKLRSRNYYNPGDSYKSSLKFNLIQNPKSDKAAPLSIVMMRHDSKIFSQIHGGNTRLIRNINPGFYKLMFLYPGTKHFATDYIEIKANGATFIDINEPDTLLKNDVSESIKFIVENAVFDRNQLYSNGMAMQNNIYDSHLKEYPYTGPGQEVIGHVYEMSSKESIVGATITVDGTTYGTISDFNGLFRIKVPEGKFILRFNYIGFKPSTIDLRTTTNINVGLEDDTKALEEVVVVGYGVQKMSALTGAVSSVSGALQGRMAGVSIGSNKGITIRGVSSIKNGENAPVIVIDGMIYTGDMSQIDPSLIESLEVLNEDNLVGLYGSRAANGVIIIKSKNNAFKTIVERTNKGAEFDDDFIQAGSDAKKLRSNFSDYAFWQPALITDKFGKARFEATFPDDVTNWQTHVLAMNPKRQSGQTSGNIKSYKPLMAQLAVPAFLTIGDSCNVIAKTLNYLTDTVKVETNYEINGHNKNLGVRACSDALIDTIPVKVIADSLTMLYSLKRENGYSDGEKRKIPIFPVGLEETKGQFYILDKDTTIQPVFDARNGKVTLYADADYLEILSKETAYLMSYRYNCNEQMASKLIAMLSDRTISKFKNDKIKHDAEIKQLINKLLKNRNADGYWGWWPGAPAHNAFSVHILQALAQAKKQDFKVDIDNYSLSQWGVRELESVFKSNENKFALLQMLKSFECEIDYKSYLKSFDTIPNLSTNQKMQLIELRQQCGMTYDKTLLKKLRSETIFGNIYFSDNNEYSVLTSEKISNTLIAYRILRNENAPDSILAKIRQFLLEAKKYSVWWNTYETAQILQTILPDVLTKKTGWEKSSLSISGSINQTITKFPFELKLTPTDKISITKKGFDAVYLTTYQRQWNRNPLPKSDKFSISTQFEGNKTVLEAGKPVKLTVSLQVKYDADYVMIKIPIPGGCSYAKKNDGYMWNQYREHFINETIIYCQKLTKGNYSFDIELLPRYNGQFVLNPTKVELMYFPVFNSNNELKIITVKR